MQIRDYVDTTLAALKDAGIYGIDSVMASAGRFEALVVDVKDRLAKQKDVPAVGIKGRLQHLYDEYKGDISPGATPLGSDFRDLMEGIAEILAVPDAEIPAAEIVIQIEDGLIQDVSGIPAGVKIVVEDFDTEGASEDEIDGLSIAADDEDRTMRPCYRTEYTADGPEFHVPDKTEIAPEPQFACNGYACNRKGIFYPASEFNQVPMSDTLTCRDCDTIAFPKEAFDSGEAAGYQADMMAEDEADRFVNYYRHEQCPVVGTAVIWQDKSPYTNNDRCPECNAEIEPYKSEDYSGDGDALAETEVAK